MKERTKALLAFLLSITAVQLVEVYFDLLSGKTCFASLLSAWLVLLLWEFYVSKGVSHD